MVEEDMKRINEILRRQAEEYKKKKRYSYADIFVTPDYELFEKLTSSYLNLISDKKPKSPFISSSFSLLG